MTYCVSCGKKQHPRAKYCHHCGKRNPKEEEIEVEEEQAAAFEIVDEVEAKEKIKKLLKEGKRSQTGSSGSMASIAVTVFVILVSFFLIGACTSH